MGYSSLIAYYPFTTLSLPFVDSFVDTWRKKECREAIMWNFENQGRNRIRWSLVQRGFKPTRAADGCANHGMMKLIQPTCRRKEAGSD